MPILYLNISNILPTKELIKCVELLFYIEYMKEKLIDLTLFLGKNAKFSA